MNVVKLRQRGKLSRVAVVSNQSGPDISTYKNIFTYTDLLKVLLVLSTCFYSPPNESMRYPHNPIFRFLGPQTHVHVFRSVLIQAIFANS